MTKIKLTHRITYDSVESDFCYPIDKGYYYICKVDKDWIKNKLKSKFGRNITHVNNKYVVQINEQLYVNHDGEYWLILHKDDL